MLFSHSQVLKCMLAVTQFQAGYLPEHVRFAIFTATLNVLATSSTINMVVIKKRGATKKLGPLW